MRALLVLAVVILLMAIAGWVRFYSSTDQAGVEFDTQEMRQDVDEIGDTLKSSVEDLRNSPDDEALPADHTAPTDSEQSPSEIAPPGPNSTTPIERN